MPQNNNSIMTIRPYRHNNMWVFDDDQTGLVKEPFVSGIDLMIDHFVAGLEQPEDGFTLIFSTRPFPGHVAELTLVRKESGGHWYHCKQLDFEGWLCPALMLYYDEAPQALYVEVRA